MRPLLLLPLIVAGDAVLGILAYRMALLVRSLSRFGVFDSPLQLSTFSQPSQLVWWLVASQVVILLILGTYRAPDRHNWWLLAGRVLMAVSAVTVFLAIASQMLLPKESIRQSIYLFFWAVNFGAIAAWRWAFFKVGGQLLGVGWLAFPDVLRIPWPLLSGRATLTHGIGGQTYDPTQGETLLEEYRGLREKLAVVSQALAALHNPVAGADSAAAVRLRQEYEARQSELLGRSTALILSLRRGKTAAQQMLNDMERQVELAQDAEEELVLRHRIGEYDRETYESKLAGHQGSISNLQAEISRLKNQLAVIKELTAVSVPTLSRRVRLALAAVSSVLEHLTVLRGMFLLGFLALMFLAVLFTASRQWPVADILATTAYLVLVLAVGTALYGAAQSYHTGENDE